MQPVQQKATTPQAPAAKRMTLTSVVKGRLRKPRRMLVYGTEKIGKSTFASQARAPIFIGAEDGTSELDVARFPEPVGWTDVLDAVHTLTVEDHPYKTAVIDTLDWAEPMCWAYICARGKKNSIEDFGYGKGYTAALDEWRILLARLDDLRASKQMDIILLAHAWIKTFKNPEADDYDRYELKLNNKAGGLIKEWCDAVLFANYETFAVEKGERVRGVSSGARLLYTQRCAAWDAGNRYGLPEVIPFSWTEFETAVQAGTPADSAKLTELLLNIAGELPEQKAHIESAIERANGDGTKLAQLLDWARGRKVISERNNGTAKEVLT